MIPDNLYEEVKAKVLQTFREINDLDVALALHGIEEPEDILQFSDDENFMAQYKLIHAQFLKELLGNMKALSRGKGSLALSATKSLLQTYHPSKFGSAGQVRDNDENSPNAIPPEREFEEVDANDQTHDPEMQEMLEEAMNSDIDPEDEETKNGTQNGTGTTIAASKENGRKSRLDKLKEDLDSRNKPNKQGETEEFLEVTLPKHKRSAITRLNK